MPAITDLHLHTTASDGRLTPSQLIELVASRGLRIVSITDHDSTEGLEEAFQAVQHYPNLTLIPGIELSTDVPGNEIHILGYSIDYADKEFQAALQLFRESREGRARRMVEKLQGLGIMVEWDRVRQIAGDASIGRPHIAQAMVENGYINYPQEAFARYLGRNGLAYVERSKMTVEEVVDLVVHVGGVPVLAHPAQIEELDQMLVRLKDAGLIGMEVHYAEYGVQVRRRLEETALRYSLLPCGGSDYHAFGTPGEPEPGDLGPPLAVAQKLMGFTEQLNK